MIPSLSSTRPGPFAPPNQRAQELLGRLTRANVAQNIVQQVKTVLSGAQAQLSANEFGALLDDLEYFMSAPRSDVKDGELDTATKRATLDGALAAVMGATPVGQHFGISARFLRIGKRIDALPPERSAAMRQALLALCSGDDFSDPAFKRLENAIREQERAAKPERKLSARMNDVLRALTDAGAADVANVRDTLSNAFEDTARFRALSTVYEQAAGLLRRARLANAQNVVDDLRARIATASLTPDSLQQCERAFRQPKPAAPSNPAQTAYHADSGEFRDLRLSALRAQIEALPATRDRKPYLEALTTLGREPSARVFRKSAYELEQRIARGI